jgi:hypothetical protein
VVKILEHGDAAADSEIGHPGVDGPYDAFAEAVSEAAASEVDRTGDAWQIPECLVRHGVRERPGFVSRPASEPDAAVGLLLEPVLDVGLEHGGIE